jgi:hypothetical protein
MLDTTSKGAKMKSCRARTMALLGTILACSAAVAFGQSSTDSHNPFPRRQSKDNALQPRRGLVQTGEGPSSTASAPGGTGSAAAGPAQILTGDSAINLGGAGVTRSAPDARSEKGSSGLGGGSGGGGGGGSGGGGAAASATGGGGAAALAGGGAPGAASVPQPHLAASNPAPDASPKLMFAKAPNGAAVASFKSGELIYGKMTGLGAKDTYGCVEVVARGDAHCSDPAKWTLLPNNDWTFMNGEWKATIASSAYPPGDYKCYFRSGVKGTPYTRMLTITPPSYQWVAVVFGPCDPGPQPATQCTASTVGMDIKNSCGNWYCHATP